jgi:hypothetical protein
MLFEVMKHLPQTYITCFYLQKPNFILILHGADLNTTFKTQKVNKYNVLGTKCLLIYWDGRGGLVSYTVWVTKILYTAEIE